MLLLMCGAVYWDYFWLIRFFWCIQIDSGTSKDQCRTHQAIFWRFGHYNWSNFDIQHIWGLVHVYLLYWARTWEYNCNNFCIRYTHKYNHFPQNSKSEWKVILKKIRKIIENYEQIRNDKIINMFSYPNEKQGIVRLKAL